MDSVSEAIISFLAHPFNKLTEKTNDGFQSNFPDDDGFQSRFPVFDANREHA